MSDAAPTREPTVNIDQAAALVGVSRRTIYNWLHAGKLQYVRTAGGSIRIFPASLWQSADTNTAKP